MNHPSSSRFYGDSACHLYFCPCRSRVDGARLFRTEWALAGDPSVGIWAFRKLAKRLKPLRAVDCNFSLMTHVTGGT